MNHIEPVRIAVNTSKEVTFHIYDEIGVEILPSISNNFNFTWTILNGPITFASGVSGSIIIGPTVTIQAPIMAAYSSGSGTTVGVGVVYAHLQVQINSGSFPILPLTYIVPVTIYDPAFRALGAANTGLFLVPQSASVSTN